MAVNAGSATVKYALFTFESEPRVLRRGSSEQVGSSRAPAVLQWLEEQTGGSRVMAIGHRIVHGGPHHRDPQRVSPELLDDLRRLIAFAPNHLPEELALVETLLHARPDVPQVVCFDTGFHSTLPEIARRLPIPRQYADQGVCRYGFHGLSFEFLLRELQRLAGPAAARSKVVLAHLGGGSSLAAIRDGLSIDTSMGFTPLGGVVMSTRSGDLDPGVVTYMARTARLEADQIERLLSHESGLLGLSDATGDMRELLARERTEPACRTAVDVYCYQIKKWIGAFAAALGGLDTLVFSGGIGQHSVGVRARICDGLGFLGVRLDEGANAASAPVISAMTGSVSVRVIPTDEESMIASATYSVLEKEGHS